MEKSQKKWQTSEEDGKIKHELWVHILAAGNLRSIDSNEAH